MLAPSSFEVTLERCVLVGNAAGSEGGAFMAGVSTPVSENETTMIHCTIVGNTAPDGGAISLGVVSNSGHSVSLDSCIVWDNGDDALAEGASDGEITAIYSDIDYHLKRKFLFNHCEPI